MGFKIEKLRKEDIGKYKELIDSCFGGSNSLEEYERKYREDAEYTIIVAKDEEKVIGSITMYSIDLFTYSFQPALELFNVAVLKEYRRNNVAKEILEYILKYAKENGYKSVYLTCLADAYGAHKLYESVGFNKLDSVKYGIDI